MNQMISPARIITGASYAMPGTENPLPVHTAIKILITPTQLVYAVSDKVSNKLVYLQPYQFPAFTSSSKWLQVVEEIFETDSWLKKEVSEKSTGVFTPCFTLVPAHFDHEKSRSSILKAHCLVNPEDMIYADLLASRKTKLLFTLPSGLNQLCSYAGSDYPKHALTGLIDHLLISSTPEAEDRLYVYFQSDSFQLIWIRKQALHFCNTFSYRSPEDLMYYLLFTCKQLRLDPELVQVILMGEIVRDSIIYNLMIKYLRNIEFVKPCNRLVFDSGYPLPHYFFYNLFCI